jgi:hypothetical protein
MTTQKRKCDTLSKMVNSYLSLLNDWDLRSNFFAAISAA